MQIVKTELLYWFDEQISELSWLCAFWHVTIANCHHGTRLLRHKLSLLMMSQQQLQLNVVDAMQGSDGVEIQAWAPAGYPDQVPRIGVRCALSAFQQA